MQRETDFQMLTAASILDMFEACVRRQPDAPAVRGGGRTYTYSDIAREVEALARMFEGVVGAGQAVAVGCESPHANAVAFLAARRAGAAVLPVDLAWPAPRLEFIFEEASVAAVVAGGGDTPFEVTSRLGRAAPPCEFEDVAYILYTSGSTGRPKGVAVSDRSLSERLRELGTVPGLRQGEAILAMTSPAFDISLAEYLLPLTTGAILLAAPGAARNDPGEFRRLVESERPDVVQATPSFWRLVDRSGWPDLSGARIWCGGERLTEHLAARLNEHCPTVWNVYGPTEMTIWATASQLRAGEPVTLGAALPGVQTYISPDDGRGPGELVLSGTGMASGYIGRPELTASRFHHAWSDGSRRGYFTGDLVERDDEGRLLFRGRCDDQVKVRGYRIELAEVESAVEAQDHVNQCAVVAVEDPETAEVSLYAFVVPDPHGDVSVRSLRTGMSARLPVYMMPRKIHVVSELPRTTAGKVDRQALVRDVGSTRVTA
ncbi:amino acid adenylation domain-containing protein [Micromonospora maritima]|uniref:amino acid adenylation domain-containing protein n=1 Tax=Micromonospora maritima TaxID=986711 RepID=UPI00379D11FF